MRKILPIPWRRQDASQLCWAACLQMEVIYRTSWVPWVDPPQCAVVERCLKLAGPCCNGAGVDAACNCPCPNTDIRSHLATLGVPGVSFYSGWFPESFLKAEIDSGRPLQIMWRRDSGPPGHVALIVGYTIRDGDYLWRVCDPDNAEGEQDLLYSQLCDRERVVSPAAPPVPPADPSAAPRKTEIWHWVYTWIGL